MATKITWHGHSAVGLETDGYRILVDPYFTDNPAADAPASTMQPDYILVSHGHFDHVGDTLDLAKRTGAMVISNFEIAGWYGKHGVEKTHAQHIGGGHRHPFGYLKFTLALHGSGLPDGTDGGNPVGFLLSTNDGKKIYLAQDTGLFGDMKLIGEEELDLAMVPIGDNFTMGPDDALRAVKFLQPKVVIPIHYNTWELIAQDVDAWAGRVRAETATQVVILKPGESYSV